MLNKGAANDGLHQPIEHWMWWAWNANSGDTGGMVSACPHISLHGKSAAAPLWNTLEGSMPDGLRPCSGPTSLQIVCDN